VVRYVSNCDMCVYVLRICVHTDSKCVPSYCDIDVVFDLSFLLVLNVPTYLKYRETHFYCCIAAALGSQWVFLTALCS